MPSFFVEIHRHGIHLRSPHSAAGAELLSVRDARRGQEHMGAGELSQRHHAGLAGRAALPRSAGGPVVVRPVHRAPRCRRLGGRGRGATAAGAAERSASGHRDEAAALRAARLQRPQVEGRRGQSPRRAGVAEDDVSPVGGRARPRLRLGTRLALRNGAADLDERSAGASAGGLRAALPARGDPRRSLGAQPARLRPVSAHRGLVQRADHQRRRHRPRRRGSAHYRGRLSRHLGGHAAHVPLAGVRGAAARARTQAAETPLGGRGSRSRRQAATRRRGGGGAGGAV